MKLKDQVVSLEYAKKLKELGFEQDSCFYFVHESAGWGPGDKWHVYPKNYSFRSSCLQVGKDAGISAFLTSELGEMLPVFIKPKFKEYRLVIKNWRNNKWTAEYRSIKDFPKKETTDKTEANARAKMLIYLKENKLI